MLNLKNSRKLNDTTAVSNSKFAQLPTENLGALLQQTNILSITRFTTEDSAAETPLGKNDPRLVQVALKQLEVSDKEVSGKEATDDEVTDKLEVLYANSETHTGRHGNIRFVADEELLVGHIQFSEHSDLHANTKQAYQEIADLLSNQPYQYLIRCWNYIPRITEQESGQERYRTFCIARSEVVEQSASLQRTIPAASAMGTKSGPLLISFIAGRNKAKQIENPRQISAYNYPQEYSPRSPWFSRAVLLNSGSDSHLIVSGTASILGHESKHINDTQAQAAETATNVLTLVEHALGGALNATLLNTDDIYLRAYVKHQKDLPYVKQAIHSVFKNQPSIIYLQADICRDNLLCEIEGYFFN